jgi:hypothetical protein
LVKEGVHLGWRCRAAVVNPPVEERKEGAGAGVSYSGAAGWGEVARGRERGETLVDGAGEVSLAKFHDVANFFRGGHGSDELTHVGDVREELLDGSDAVGGVSTPDKGGGHHFPKIFDVAEEEIVLVAVVRVEGGAADVCAIEDMLDGYGFEGLFVHQGD